MARRSEQTNTGAHTHMHRMCRWRSIVGTMVLDGLQRSWFSIQATKTRLDNLIMAKVNSDFCLDEYKIWFLLRCGMMVLLAALFFKNSRSRQKKQKQRAKNPCRRRRVARVTILSQVSICEGTWWTCRRRPSQTCTVCPSCCLSAHGALQKKGPY